MLIRVEGPPQAMTVRRRVHIMGLWVPGPSATFPEVPAFYALAGTRPHWEVLGESERAAARLGLTNIPLRSIGDQAPVFRAALLTLKREGRAVDRTAGTGGGGGRAPVLCPYPAARHRAAGEYRVSVLLVAEGRVRAWEQHRLSVDRIGIRRRHCWAGARLAAALRRGVGAAGRPGRLVRQHPVPQGIKEEKAMTTAEAAAARRDRVFLVVVDDTPERAVALRYAALRAKKSGGRVALLRVLEPAGLVEWAGVEQMMAEERRQEAEALLSALAAEVQEITGGMPILIIREGDPREELLKLLEEDPRISILVLAAAPGSGDLGR